MKCFLLTVVLYLSSFPFCPASASPHPPRNLTWMVISDAGHIVWSTSKVTTNQWWPDLFPDICQLAVGATGWDLEEHPDLQEVPYTCTSDEWTVRGRAWGGCCHGHWRNVLRTQEFYVCPGFHRDRSLDPKCGGKLDFYCKSWGCETSGQAHWNPTSSWDYISVTANYSLKDYVPGDVSAGECEWNWCHPLRVTFTEKGKKATDWLKGYTWGLRFYLRGYDEGLIFTVKLQEEALYTSLGSNPVLSPIRPQPKLQKPLASPRLPERVRRDVSSIVPTTEPLREGSHLFDLVEKAFKVLNATNPEATESCWLCYDMAPPYFEGIAFIGTVNQTEDINQCRWQQQQNVRLTLVVSGSGLCMGKVPPSYEFLCSQNWPIPSGRGYLLPPTEGLWACSSGLTPCVDLQALRDTQDFCVLVQVVPRLIYYTYEELLSHWDSGLPRAKRKPLGITLPVLLGLELWAAGGGEGSTGGGASASVIRDQNLKRLQAAVNADIQELENSISILQESLTSLSEIVLQNRRSLELQFLRQRGLCATLRGECCFYGDHSGVIKDSTARVRKGLAERERERQLHQGWYESWYDSSPWLTTLISAISGTLVTLLLLLIFGSCVLNRLHTFIRERISAVQVMMLRQQYQELNRNVIAE